MKNVKIQYLNIDELTPYAQNARKHGEADVAAIRESIRAFGFNDPVGVWGDQNIIVEGHGRVLAARQLGLKEIPCIRLDHLTDEERRAYTLAHNKTAELSEWDFDVQAAELEGITDIDMGLFGFEMETEEEPEVQEDDFSPEIPEEARVKLGEIYRLGEHRLMCGDSTKGSDIEKLMGGVEADMLLTDPPYNVGLGMNQGHPERPSEMAARRRRTDGKVIQNDLFQEEEDFVSFIFNAFMSAMKATKAGGAFYIWYAPTQALNFLTACRRAGMKIRQEIIWNKGTFALVRQDYQWKHEPCLYGWKDGAGHYFADLRTETTVIPDAEEINPKKMKKEELVKLCTDLLSDKIPTTVIKEDKPSRSEEHPTMKPVKLFARLIKNSSRKGDTVLDIFGGSGTSIIACEQLGRRCYMMELDPKYCDVIIDRWERFTGQKAELVKT